MCYLPIRVRVPLRGKEGERERASARESAHNFGSRIRVRIFDNCLLTLITRLLSCCQLTALLEKCRLSSTSALQSSHHIEFLPSASISFYGSCLRSLGKVKLRCDCGVTPIGNRFDHKTRGPSLHGCEVS